MARIDTTDLAMRQQFLACVRQAHQQHPQAQVFALLDLSFADVALRGALADQLPEPLSLLCGHFAGEGLERVDIWLAVLPGLRPDGILALAGLCAGRPMFSLILAATTPSSLQTHLRQQLEAKDDQGRRHILRWADTRCLPSLYHSFDAQQQARLMAGLGAWIYPGRNGESQLIAGNPLGRLDAHQRPQPYDLSAAQALALRTAARPDAILSLIAARPQLYGKLAGLHSLQHAAARAALNQVADQAATAEAVRAVTQSLQLQGLLE